VKTSEWTNAMMGPPSESFSELMGLAVHNQAATDELVHMFANPVKAHQAFFRVSGRGGRD
jgi:hypothetical protein